MAQAAAPKHAAARTALAAQRWDAAEAELDACLDADAQDWQAHDLLGDVAQERGDQRLAASHRARAVCANAHAITLQKKFLQTAGGQKYRTHDADIEAAMTICLANEAIASIAGADPLWVWTLRQRPGFDALFQKVSNPRFFQPRNNPFSACTDLRPLLDPYFQQGVRKILICWLQFEVFLTFLRGFLLKQCGAAQPCLSTAEQRALAVTLALYCFRTDYIFHITPSEQQQLVLLQERVAQGTADALAVAVLACYQPLHTLPNRAAVTALLHANPDLQPLAAQLQAHEALQSGMARIECLFPFQDETSRKVQAQYEDFPYPRWTHLEDFANPLLPAESQHLAEAGKSILIAGCGTGLQPCLMARQFPHSKILAIDLTAASLAYAQSQAQALGLTNITFRQADILALDRYNETFDYVSCFGVLHHMADPELGWQKLMTRLKPEGLMEIGLYSRHARRVVTTGRARIAQLKIPPTPAGMRAFRRKSRWLFSPRDYATLTNWFDYFSLNMYRDLLFHAHEDHFDIPRIQRALDKLGLVFAGFKLPEATLAAYRERFPDDPALLNLAHWQAFEAAQPDSFGACYRFLCRRA